jgi:hypothetical protein
VHRAEIVDITNITDVTDIADIINIVKEVDRQNIAEMVDCSLIISF